MANTVAERVRQAGFGAASPIDLIAVGFSRREEDVSEDMARALLKRLGKIQALGELSPTEIREETGLDGFELLRAMALVELGRRAGGASKGWRDEIDGPEDVAELFSHLAGEKREHFCLVLLDSKNKILKTSTIHIGTVNYSVVGSREVFREAIREGATSLIAVHNHPSGDPTPSPEDIEVTKKLVSVGDMLDIAVLDHVIIGERRFISLKRQGLM